MCTRLYIRACSHSLRTDHTFSVQTKYGCVQHYILHLGVPTAARQFHPDFSVFRTIWIASSMFPQPPYRPYFSVQKKYGCVQHYIFNLGVPTATRQLHPDFSVFRTIWIASSMPDIFLSVWKEKSSELSSLNTPENTLRKKAKWTMHS